MQGRPITCIRPCFYQCFEQRIFHIDIDGQLAPSQGVGRLHDVADELRLFGFEGTYEFAAAKRGAEHFGRLNVVVSNAGYDALGMIEEIDIDIARKNFETNFFGTLSLV